MGQFYGSPSDFSRLSSQNSTINSAMSSRTSSPQVDSSFKAPMNPKMEGDTSWMGYGTYSDQNDSAIMNDFQGEAQPIPEGKCCL